MANYYFAIMKHSFLFLVLFSLIFQANIGRSQPDNTNENGQLVGERIDGPANVRESANGKILFSLNDNVLVETEPMHNNWYSIGVFVKLSDKEYENFQILPGANLLSYGNKVIGKAIDTVNVLFGDKESGLISGYTFKNNIKNESIPERKLEELINSNNLSFSSLEKYIKNFEFEKYTNRNLTNISEYFIYESLMVDISPRDRISLLFRKNELIGIVHSREIICKEFKTYELIRGHKLTITSDLSEEEIEVLIEKNINFYNSVD